MSTRSTPDFLRRLRRCPPGLFALGFHNGEQPDFIDSTLYSTDLLLGVSTYGVDGPVLRHPDPPDSLMALEAGIVGSSVVDGECLYVEHEVGRNLVVWPFGTSWRSDPAAVVLNDGSIVELGERVSGTGGYFDLDRVRLIAGDAAAELAQNCVGPAGEVGVMNNLGTTGSSN